MPTTKEKTSFQRARVPELGGAGGEPPGEPPAPPLEVREPRGLSRELVDDAVERARLRWMLERPDGERISDEVIDQLLAGARTEAEIAGPGGLLAQLTKRLVERAMEVELEAGTFVTACVRQQQPPAAPTASNRGCLHENAVAPDRSAVSLLRLAEQAPAEVVGALSQLVRTSSNPAAVPCLCCSWRSGS